MADEADDANEHIEREFEMLVRRRKKIIHPCGFCFFCHEKLKVDSLFCDSDCAIDYEREEKLKRITGR